MLSVGLTGSFGSGKTTVSAMFADLGAQVLDADKIALSLIKRAGRCHRRVVKEFGKNILTKGNIDRKKLAAVVFNDLKKRKKLEKIIHPEVLKEIRSGLAKYKRRSGYKVVVVDVPLLFESGFDRYVDLTIVVRADQKQQVARVMKRTDIAKNNVLKRIKAQWPMRRKVKKADFVVDNRGSSSSTKKQVKEIWRIIIDSCRTVNKG